ncbi:PAS domain-containing protein [Halalkalibaculum sp. DA384]
MRPFEFFPVVYFTNGKNRIIGVNEQFKNKYSNSFDVIGRSLDEIKQPILPDNFVSSPFLAGEREFAFFHFNKTKTELVELVYAVEEFEEESINIAFFNEIFSPSQFNEQREANLPGKCKNLGEIVFLLNNDEKIQHINEAASHKLGYSKQELLGVHISQIIYPDLGSYLEKKWKLMLCDGESSGEYLLQTKKDELLFVEYRAVANIRLGLHLMLIRDIATVISNNTQTSDNSKNKRYN